jgi:hypothetical protein
VDHSEEKDRLKAFEDEILKKVYIIVPTNAHIVYYNSIILQ